MHVLLCWVSDGDELLEVPWSCLVDAFNCEQPYLVGDSALYGQPVQALECIS